MKTHTTFPKIFLIIGLIAININCSKDPDAPPQADKPVLTDGTVFINSTDPRLAEVLTDKGSLVTFFGKRDEQGMPVALTGWTIHPASNPAQQDIITLDVLGRYATVSLFTGESFHFEYPSQDSVLVAFKSASDSINVYKLQAVEGWPKDKRKAMTEGKRFHNQNSVKIKVVARNEEGQEKNVNNSQVLVRMIGQVDGNLKDYSFQAWPEEDGIYSFPIPQEFVADNNLIIKTTIDIIKNGIEFACYDCNKSCPPMISTLYAACAAPQFGFTLAICLAIPRLVLACEIGGDAVPKLLEQLQKKINNYNPNPDAALIISSTHFEYGTEYLSPGTSLNQIRNDPTPNPAYDVLIPHADKSIVGAWSGNYSLSDGESGSFTAIFYESREFTYLEYDDGELERLEGTWIQSGDKLTFVFSDAERYFAVRESKSKMGGNVVFPDGTTGTWSASR